MNAIVWNCRGAGNSRTVRDLDALVRHHNPKLVFLSETMISESRVKNLRWRLGLKGCLAVDSRGKRGGIVLFWDESIQVNLLSIEERYIDVSIVDDPNGAPWRATFIYMKNPTLRTDTACGRFCSVLKLDPKNHGW